MSDGEGTVGGGSAGRTQILQPGRDLQSNWELDLAKYLEDYLLKICSGESTTTEEDRAFQSINFAEAALLVQGSVQVYSRKVEYLYSLVLHALEFLSQKRQQDEQQKDSAGPDEIGTNPVGNQEDEVFLGLDDVPVDPKNSLDNGLDKGNTVKQCEKPPADLVVLEGDCLDSNGGDGSELESYLLATCEFYSDFLLLDPYDSVTVQNFLRGKSSRRERETDQPNRGSSIRSKNRHSAFKSPSVRSSNGKNKENNIPENGQNMDNFGYEAGETNSFPNDYNMEEGFNADFGDFRDESENDEIDDPWKPLNPHEPGNLRIKPFRKVKLLSRPVNFITRRCTLLTQFPVAKLERVISPDLAKIFEERVNLKQKQQNSSESVPIFEQLMRSLTLEEREKFEGVDQFGDGNNNNNNVDSGDDNLPDYDMADADMANDIFDNMDADLLNYPEKESGNDGVNNTQCFPDDNLDSRENLEDLCRSHLDTLLASVAETEKQTELAIRVSTWKDRIEHAMKEQDSHLPFDIGFYGERILEKISVESENNNAGKMLFTDVVAGQPHHEVARTFSALLQLVNGGKVDLEKTQMNNGELVCHTAENPFYIHLLSPDQIVETIQPDITGKSKARKRVKSPVKKGSKKANSSVKEHSSPENSPQKKKGKKITVKLGKVNTVRCTPVLTEPIEL